MMNIKQLAIEHGILELHEEALEGDVYVVGNVSIGRLEAFAKALQQQSEPVGYTSQGYIDGVKNSIGDLGNFAGSFFKNKWENANIPLFTQPPNTVSLEQYNKLLDVLNGCSKICGKIADSDINDRDMGGVRMCEEAIDMYVMQAIAEAERSAK